MPTSEADEQVKIEEWWDGLSQFDRDRFKQAVRQYPADPSLALLLVSAGEPMSTCWTLTSLGGQGQSFALHGPVEKFIEERFGDEYTEMPLDTNSEMPLWFEPLHHAELADILREPEAILPGKIAAALSGDSPPASPRFDPQRSVGVPAKPPPDRLSDWQVTQVREARAHLDAWWCTLAGSERLDLIASKEKGWLVADQHLASVERLGPMGAIPLDGPPTRNAFKLPLVVRAYILMRKPRPSR